MALPINLLAFTLVTRNPSTAGICAADVNCKILLAAVPTSTLSVPAVEILPPVRPVPAETSVTDPPAPHPPDTVLQFKPALSQIVVTRRTPAISRSAFGVVVPIPTLPVEVRVMRMALFVTTLRLVRSVVPRVVVAPNAFPPLTKEFALAVTAAASHWALEL